MIFTHVSLIQEGQCALFYRYDKKLKSYLIAGLFVSDTLQAKLDLAKVWGYFVSEVVKADDIYCSIVLDQENALFKNYLSYSHTDGGIKIYKVDNYLKEQYSNYTKHLQRAEQRKRVKANDFKHTS